ncbi:MAG: methylmalonyl-CoA mutase subunit beta [Polaribacter sp.]|nr:methylmalonyl-CoA mutase subunit beta [Polaribacter sp.]MDG1811103.1 methylmalonyl-CoA mutase subunit beta [Polaribacter sp.]MDG1993474.1 methylmalonyl-CoA mutase subunit beta [Polaribacter sp.]
MKSTLFNQFETTSPSAWKQKIQVDLKGVDYNETLLWKTDEDIVVKPFYTKEDRKNDALEEAPFKFNISQSIFVNDEKTTNYIAINAIEKGANTLEFVANKKFDYKILLEKIDFNNTNIYFRFHFLDADFCNQLSNHINSKNCFFQVDIINRLAQTGNWFINLKADHSALEKIVNNTNNAIGIDAALYQNAGATITQQLAYTLAHANEYLNYFGKKEAANFHFNFAIGSNYFFEIAKIKAFRILWQTLLKQYDAEITTAHIFAQPTHRNKTIYDYNVNMLRTTSECMSAILGGVNTINNLSYDSVFHKKNEFGERISRNQLLILQQESYLKEANTFANGSYYIENITHQLAENALQIFKGIEKSGGFLKQLKAGTIQRKISENATKEQNKFNAQEIVLLGINNQPNLADKMKNEIEIYPFLKTKAIKTLISPIIRKRLSETYEKNRLENES